MIIKRIRKSALKRRRPLRHIAAAVKALTTYAIDAEPELLKALESENRSTSYILDVAELGIEPGEKVEMHGTRNLVGDSLIQHQQQMLAACLLAPDALDPLEHYVISWRAGEVPSAEDIDEVVTIFSDEMGYDQSPVFWAVHSNTAQWHLHIVACRINLVDGSGVLPGDGWDIDRLHQVLALVEDRQGWSSEQNAIYFVKDGVLYDEETKKVVRRADGSRDGCYKRIAASPEHGQCPEYANILTALRDADSWRDLHYRLGLENAAYREKGSGAEIRIGERRMPAFDFGREFAFKKMTERLGEFEPDIAKEQDPHERYQALLRDERARLRQELNSTLEHLRRKRRQALHHARRRERNQFLQAIVEERLELAFDRAEAAIKLEFDVVRRTIAASYLNRDRWYRAGQPAPIRVAPPEMVYAAFDFNTSELGEAQGFVRESHAAGAEYLNGAGERAFSDYGVILLLHQVDAQAVEAMLSLASARTDVIEVFGPPEFLELCRSVSDARGFRLVTEDGLPLETSKVTPTATNRETVCADRPSQPPDLFAAGEHHLPTSRERGVEAHLVSENEARSIHATRSQEADDDARLASVFDQLKKAAAERG